MKIKILLTSASLCLLTACASKPVRLTDVKEGNWSAKALIKDKDANRSYIVYLNFNAVKNEHARMDVTSSIGTGVASLVTDPKEVRYVLLDSKRFYYGEPQPDVMRPILALPFNPMWIHNILFEDAIVDKGWACERDGEGWLASCRDAASNTKVTWGQRNGPTKSVSIEHPRASVQINIQQFRPKVESRPNLFTLEAPAGYQKLKVR